MRMFNLLTLITALALMVGCSDSTENSRANTDQPNAVVPKHIQRFTAPESLTTGQAANVLEFFSYSCLHCQAFAPLISNWATQQQASVEYVPVAWNEDTELYARFFYLIRSQSNFAELHPLLFERVMSLDSHEPLDQRKILLIEWLQQQGIEPVETLNLLSGEAVEQAIGRVKQLSAHYQIASTPTLVVNGTDKILNSELTSYQHLLDVAASQLLPQRAPQAAQPKAQGAAQ